jgi:phosphoenolpyruvate carboxylase
VHQEDEPYRRALVTCYARMAATRAALLGTGPVRPAALQSRAYCAPEDFAADLDVIAASLAENGDADLGDGRLLNLREAVSASVSISPPWMCARTAMCMNARWRNCSRRPEWRIIWRLDEEARAPLLLGELAMPARLRSPYADYSAKPRASWPLPTRRRR